MKSSLKVTVALVVVFAALLATSVSMQIVRDRLTPAHRATARYLYLQSDAAVRRLSLAYQMVAADVYWIRALQHYGGDRLSSDVHSRYELLYPLLDITTTLDPRFVLAYRFGAIFLAEEFPGGPGRPDQAIALLLKGLKTDPTKWQYLHDIAFVYYWQLRDPVTAAQWFERASKVPGAPNWLSSVAAVMLAKGGERTASRFLWQQIRNSSEQEWLRATASWRLLQLDALDQIDQLEAIVRRFEREAVAGDLTWPRLIQAGMLRGVPLDPTGTPYELDPRTGLVTVSPDSKLFPMPNEPPGHERPVS